MRILGIDPGHTTGVAIVEDGKVEAFYTTNLWTRLDTLFTPERKPDVVVYEDFRLYPWMAKSKSWSHLETVQVIGVIKYLCELHEIPVETQMASVIKSKLAQRLFGDVITLLPEHAREAALHALLHHRRLQRRK